MLIKYCIILLSLILIFIDIKNIKERLDTKNQIIAEVISSENRCLVKINSYPNG